MASLVARYRHVYLLTTLVLMMLVRPFLPADESWTSSALDIFLLAMVVAGIHACAPTRGERLLALALGIATLLATVAGEAQKGVGWAHATQLVCGLGFFALLVVVFMKQVFRTERVGADTIYGAITVYLFLGVTWTYAYALLFHVDPSAFALGERVIERGGLGAFSGFSFVTLTTLGYGNIYPQTQQAEALATMQAIVGQLYLTVLVARLVGMQVSQAGGPSPGPESR
jgi:hypothetical protein